MQRNQSVQPFHRRSSGCALLWMLMAGAFVAVGAAEIPTEQFKPTECFVSGPDVRFSGVNQRHSTNSTIVSATTTRCAIPYGPFETPFVSARAARDLRATQNADGSWADGDPAATAIALLGLAAADYLPGDEEFGPCIEAAVRFLCEFVPPDGRLPPGDTALPAQPIAALALCDLFFRTRNPLILEAARRAIRPVIEELDADELVASGDLDRIVWDLDAVRAAFVANLRDEALRNELARLRASATTGLLERISAADGAIERPLPVAYALDGLDLPDHPLIAEALDYVVHNASNLWADCRTRPRDDPARFDWFWAGLESWRHGREPFRRWNQEGMKAINKAQTIVPAAESGVKDWRGRPRERGFWGDCADARDRAVLSGLYLFMLPSSRWIPKLPITGGASASTQAENREITVSISRRDEPPPTVSLESEETPLEPPED